AIHSHNFIARVRSCDRGCISAPATPPVLSELARSLCVEALSASEVVANRDLEQRARGQLIAVEMLVDGKLRRRVELPGLKIQFGSQRDKQARVSRVWRIGGAAAVAQTVRCYKLNRGH